MPAISLVVCVYKERDFLERLLREAKGSFDDLVVVHDGPEGSEGAQNAAKPAAIDYATHPSGGPLPGGYTLPAFPPKPGSMHALVVEHGGRFFEGGRSFQQEPHWPFAWSEAREDWILRFDADEFPSADLCAWLRNFRAQPESPAVAGYTCVWPLWNGRRAVTHHWPVGRNFLFHRQRVRFFGMVEQVPIADTSFEDLDLVLHHEPTRKSYGVGNLLLRRQAYHWRRVIALSLLSLPADLPNWRWGKQGWPANWQQVREKPLTIGLRRLLISPLRQAREMWKQEGTISFSAIAGTGLHHFMMSLTFFVCKLRHPSHPDRS